MHQAGRSSIFHTVHTGLVEDSAKRMGRPSKGPRHSFTVKLDVERAAKLKEILVRLDISGTDYLKPVVDAHLDGIDRHQPINQPRQEPRVVAKNSTTSISRSAVQRKPTQEESLLQAQTLAGKINLLLDLRAIESGQTYAYPAIRDGVEKHRVFLSRTRWSLLKEGKVQVVPDEYLRAIAKVFDVAPEYLLHDDAELPADLEAMLPQVRIERLLRVRDFAVRALGPVDPERLRAITDILDQAIQE